MCNSELPLKQRKYSSKRCLDRFHNAKRSPRTKKQKLLDNSKRRQIYQESVEVRESKQEYRATKGREFRRQRIHNNNLYTLESMRGGCVSCGETDLLVLEFDHITDKTKNVSHMRLTHNIEALKKEIAKCVVLCANCHKRKTAKQFGWWRLQYVTEL